MKRRRLFMLVLSLVGLAVVMLLSTPEVPQQESVGNDQSSAAVQALEQLEVKGRAPKTGYERSQFGNGWATVSGCSVRQIILNRDLAEVVLKDECTAERGLLNDPYTGEEIIYKSSDPAVVQIDHVVALSDAWQKGAQQLTRDQRIDLANDPLNLLAVDGPANQQKGDGDAATWLPENRGFRCEYIARQIAVKQRYQLWVTEAEKSAMNRVLEVCPGQALP